MLDPKKPLNITVAEPVVFLRTSDPTGRHQSDQSDSPTLVRGILTLNVTKPIGISSIDVELTGQLSISYPEAIGSRRVDLPERHKIYSSTVTVFRADQALRPRLSASVGPGLSPTNHGGDQRTASFPSRLPSLPRGRCERRAVTCLPSANLDPTPPYIAVQSPPNQTMLSSYGEGPAQTLEALRQSLRENPRARAGFASPSHRSPIASSLANPSMHSDSLSSSDDSFHRESANRDVVHTHISSPLEDEMSLHSIVADVSHIPHQGPLSSAASRAHSPESPDGAQPQPHGASPARPASNSRLRLSLSSVLDAVREITSRTPSRSRSIARLEEGERGRTRVRTTTEEQSAASILESVGPWILGPHTHPDHREHHLLGLGRVLGFERDHEKDKEDELKSKEQGWREFKPGVYSYPISFLLPPHLPPTFNLQNGSLQYAIKGVAHRPGTFTSKLSCQVPLLVVSAPAVGDGEDGAAGDPGPLLVQKQWETKLAYSFGLSSRLLLLGSERHLGAAASASVGVNPESLVEVGVEARPEPVYGTATLDVTLLPIEKVKIWKLEVIIDQHVRYSDERGRPCRDDDAKQVRLLTVQDACSAEEMYPLDEGEPAHKNKHKHKHSLIRIPLLPTPLSPHRSPLLRYLAPSSDPSVLAGPGPYALSTVIGLPGCNDASGGDSGPLNFTLKQRSSSVKVEHSLRLVMRVESIGDQDAHHGEQGEKKRLFDIAVQTPINVLSCRCLAEHQTLPRYSQFTEDRTLDRVACPCRPPRAVDPAEREHAREAGEDAGHVMTPSPSSSFDNAHADGHHGGENRSRPPSPRPGMSAGGSLAGLHLASPVSWAREAGQNGVRVQSPPSQAQAQAQVQTQPRAHAHPDAHSQSQAASFSTPHSSRPPSPLARYERLVSGLESEAGEAPPSYESVASGP